MRQNGALTQNCRHAVSLLFCVLFCEYCRLASHISAALGYGALLGGICVKIVKHEEVGAVVSCYNVLVGWTGILFICGCVEISSCCCGTGAVFCGKTLRYSTVSLLHLLVVVEFFWFVCFTTVTQPFNMLNPSS